MSIKLISTGSCVGDRVLDNHTLKDMVDTTDEWIRSRTGIVERRIADNYTTEELAYMSCKRAVENSGIDVSDIELLIVASISSDTTVPSSAYKVAGMMGIGRAVCFDINAACSGFLYSITVAKSMMKAMGYRYAAVIGAEKLSKYVNWEDRSTCVLFGDGAGCAILKNDDIENNSNRCEYEIVDQIIGGYYDSNKYLTVNSNDCVGDEASSEYISMNGRQVYKFATSEGEGVLTEIMSRHSISDEDVLMVVPHQANKRIIDTLSEKTKIGIDKWFINLDRYGNTSAASIPIALDESIGSLDLNKEKGKYILSVAFGGGLSYGAILLKIV